jgi:hypothetical protein
MIPNSPKKYKGDLDDYYHENKYSDDEQDEEYKSEVEYLYEEQENEEDQYADYFISQEAEWREFGDDPKSKEKSRVGGVRLINQELENLIGVEMKDKIKKILTTPSLNFQASCATYIAKYKDNLQILKSEKNLNDMISMVVNKIPNIRFKNPKAFVLGMCLIELTTLSNKKKSNVFINNKKITIKNTKVDILDYLYDISKEDDISKVDILKYTFLIEKYFNTK